MKAPDQRLKELANLFEERGKIYGDGYKNFGGIIKEFFPEGVSPRSSENVNRFYLITMIITKLKRYCNTFEDGGHIDSLDDLAVYAMILQSYDEEVRNESPNHGM